VYKWEREGEWRGIEIMWKKGGGEKKIERIK
jgi:hypothetical protein